MDDAAIRKRCEEWASKQGLMEYDFVGNGGWEHTGALVELVKAAFADGQRDGMERAANVDEQAGTGYIYLHPIADGAAVEQVQVESKHLILDFDQDGELLGIEFLDLSVMPKQIRQAADHLGDVNKMVDGGRPQ